MQIIWTKHAEERQQQWRQTRPEITREAIETVLNYPGGNAEFGEICTLTISDVRKGSMTC